ncbi:MAG: class I SAM-dependent methyltransferase [Bryobacterales bacterium]|nr:class I SAM-dependent methyltransferase [Bryobacterales bacterium]
MHENCSNSGWTAARGEKWRGQLARMEAMLAPVDEPLIRALRLDAPCGIAEVGCGGGGTSVEILRRAPAGSVVHGFDISPAMIEVARGRGTAPGEVAFDIADMERAVPPSGMYERLASRFGVMFFADPPAAFRNLLRWLVPAGRFAFAVWGRPSDNPWMSIVRETVSGIVDIPPSDPDAPGPFRYGDASRLLHLLDEAGYRDLEVSDWRGMLPIGGELPAEEAAEFALASFSNFAELLLEAGDLALRDARALLTQRLSPYQQDGFVRMDARVHIVTGAAASREAVQHADGD